MPKPRRRMSAFAAATTSGVLIGLILQVLLAKRGIELTGVWRDIVSNAGLQFRSAIAWWSIAGAAFVSSFAIATAMDRFRWLYLRFMKWVLGLAAVYYLAVIGHAASATPGLAIATHFAASLAAFATILLMSCFGAYFAVRT